MKICFIGEIITVVMIILTKINEIDSRNFERGGNNEIGKSK